MTYFRLHGSVGERRFELAPPNCRVPNPTLRGALTGVLPCLSEETVLGVQRGPNLWEKWLHQKLLPKRPVALLRVLCLGTCASRHVCLLYSPICAPAHTRGWLVASCFHSSCDSVGSFPSPCPAKGWHVSKTLLLCFLCLHTHGFYPSPHILNTFTHTLEMSVLQRWVSAPSQGPGSSVRAARLQQHRSKGPGQGCVPSRQRHTEQVRWVCLLQGNH